MLGVCRSDQVSRPACLGHIPENVRVTTIERWRDYAYRLGISDGEARAQQQAFRRAKDGLLAKQLLGVWNDHVWAVA
jgi:hypothetical protein